LSNSHWAKFHRLWAQYTPPLRPNGEVAGAVRDALAGHDERVLLLGVTPELADAGRDVTALDSSELMIGGVWPGDGPHRRAVKGNWLSMPFDFAAASFSAAIGDGCLSSLSFPEGHQQLYGQLARVLRPGGRLVLRLFKVPDRTETLPAVLKAARDGTIRNFHAFKWRLAMALTAASGDPNIAVELILATFEREFPDRRKLAAMTGWPLEQIDTIEVYRGSSEVYSFTTFEQIRQTMPSTFTNLRLQDIGSYELAERCPLLIMDRRS
jgi:SAM-dependent methyltransferase